MAQLASPSPLTAENLKIFSPSLSHNYSASVSSRASEDEDDASLFSDAHSVVSSTSTAPEDEAAPFTVQEASGETVTVYESLDQAVRYSLLRAEQARRQEEETRRFAYMPYSAAPQQSQDVILNEASWVSAPAPPPAGDAQGDADEEDEDAYFSMG